MCAYIPTTLPKSDLLPAQLSTMFLLETFIHAKEKPTMVQWIELLTKQFNQCHDACEVCLLGYVTEIYNYSLRKNKSAWYVHTL